MLFCRSDDGLWFAVRPTPNIMLSLFARVSLSTHLRLEILLPKPFIDSRGAAAAEACIIRIVLIAESVEVY